MKKIEAIVRPAKLESIRQSLEESGFPGLMVTEIEGCGKQKGIDQQWRGKKYKVELLPKIKIEIVAKDQDVERIVKVISETAKTGAIGDGKIFIYNIENAIRIRTGEKGDITI
ncbi:MAG: P-II family nitrogen regulator [Elusimicrobia bacterium]|nr:P-II family nitrogen regulator [Elusimicrobiota bacterium]